MAAEAFVEIWQYVRTSYGADILPTERPCISLDNIIITVIIVVTVFSDRESWLRDSYTAEMECMATGSVCVPT